MRKLYIELNNCFGIKKLSKEFDYSNNNTCAIYARNGLMKTSFSKTLKKIQNNKQDEIKDEIFDIQGKAKVEIDGQNIKPDDVFVIKSIENSYESDSIASLLVNDDLKKSISSVLKLKDNFLKRLENYSGLKVCKTFAGKKNFELETVIVEDFEFNENSFLLNIDNFIYNDIDMDLSQVKYLSIFDESVLNKIKSNVFQNKIIEFIKRSDEIYREFGFLEKGSFTLPKLKDTEKALTKNNFFVNKNKIKLSGTIELSTIDELSNKIKEIDAKLKDTPELKDIEKMLSDAKGIIFKDVIENNPDIVEFLAIDKLDELRRKMWLSYIKAESEKYEELKNQYHKLEAEVNSLNLDHTPWKKALNIFEERFTVPYKMEISNMRSSIIGESIPRVEFSFCKDGNMENKKADNWVKLNRSELDSKDTLSEGEKRALYLLNVIFDIEQRKSEQKETLFIIDDIADSFDYKNKYAIVEYLYEMTKNDEFYLLILSHNFDFYRTVSLRLNLGRENRLCANVKTNGIVLEQEKYQNQPFEYWKKHIDKKNAIALIPFVRNIVEYGVDKNVAKVSKIKNDYMLLTNLLHVKDSTDLITFATLKRIYKEYININEDKLNFYKDSDSVSTAIFSVADSIIDTDVDLENKIVLAIAIRHKAESYMKSKIHLYSGNLTWKVKKDSISGNNEEFMKHVNSSSNQTRELFGGFKQFGKQIDIELLEQVNIMTPENIHLNSFMYEPILDMDIVELKKLYLAVKGLIK